MLNRAFSVAAAVRAADNPDSPGAAGKKKSTMKRRFFCSAMRLCRLLFDVGSVAASEYLLRRKLEYYEGHALYVRLFGTARQEEFDAAIEAFKSQFDVDLELLAEKDFLISTFRSDGGPPRFDDFALLSRPCEIKFGYIEQNMIEADVALFAPGRDVLDADECMVLFFVNGVWEDADAMDA